MTNLELATKLVNVWNSECLSLPVREHDIRLVEIVAFTLDNAEQAAYERGVEDEKARWAGKKNTS
jgi:hypothetical protein